MTVSVRARDGSVVVVQNPTAAGFGSLDDDAVLELEFDAVDTDMVEIAVSPHPDSPNATLVALAEWSIIGRYACELYGDAELTELLGGSGGGGGGDDEQHREGAGGAGSGGAVLLSTGGPMVVAGRVSALGGRGGRDEIGDPNHPVQDGQDGGEGRIKLVAGESYTQTQAAVLTPQPGSMPALPPYTGGDIYVPQGATVTLSTDLFSEFTMQSLTVLGLLTAEGDRPLVITVAGEISFL
eukprot:SAG22_NODE_3334_length_1773_cov_1.336918_1_plen_239_part_00